MKRYCLALFVLFALPGTVVAQNLQTVTTNGNTTNTNLIIDPAGDVFRSLSIMRLNGTATSQFLIANNKTYGALNWIPNNAVLTTQYGLILGANQLSYANNGTTETIWRTGNMGAGSGLNADLLDGLHAASLFRYGAGTLGDPTIYPYSGPGLYSNFTFQPANGVPNNNYGAYLYVGNLTGDATYAGLIGFGTNSGNLYTKRKVGGVWETSWRTIWDSNNFSPASYLPLAGGSMTGDLTIGSTTTQHQLNVNGNIKARKVKVTVTDWPDYVFDSAYRLMPLHQLEHYIADNKHLPDLPSAETVQTQGVELGQNQAALLKKIEELTLYILAQQEKQEAMEKRLAEVEKDLAEKKK